MGVLACYSRVGRDSRDDGSEIGFVQFLFRLLHMLYR